MTTTDLPDRAPSASGEAVRVSGIGKRFPGVVVSTVMHAWVGQPVAIVNVELPATGLVPSALSAHTAAKYV